MYAAHRRALSSRFDCTESARNPCAPRNLLTASMICRSAAFGAPLPVELDASCARTCAQLVKVRPTTAMATAAQRPKDDFLGSAMRVSVTSTFAERADCQRSGWSEPCAADSLQQRLVRFVGQCVQWTCQLGNGRSELGGERSECVEREVVQPRRVSREQLLQLGRIGVVEELPQMFACIRP